MTGKRWPVPWVDASVWHRYDSAAAAHEFCGRHGMNADDVQTVEYDVIDIPLLRFHCFELDANGAIRLRPGNDEIAMRPPVERPLIGSLPEWWTP